jgi:uncharacterized protein
MNENEVKSLAEEGYFRASPLHGRIEETHISWIILTKQFAFKIKKPLKFSFLDFSTIAKRRRYCKREVQLNSRLSDIYLDVVQITHQNGSWHIGKGKSKIKDYAVRMKRMRSSRKMDIMLGRHEIKEKHIVELAKTIARFHKTATVTRAPFEISTACSLFNDINVLCDYIGKYLGQPYSVLIDQAVRWSNEFLAMYASRFQDRISSGFKRDVHGDFHTGNIFIYKKPVIFDCIEFNDSYRQIDVINEVAFFCMDLEFNRQKTLSRFFLAEYLRHFSCFQTKTDNLLFTYFKCYRANVRAKVNIISAQQESDSQRTFQKHIRAARTYLQLMKSYMILSDQ